MQPAAGKWLWWDDDGDDGDDDGDDEKLESFIVDTLQ